jgi:hypothetical protein
MGGIEGVSDWIWQDNITGTRYRCGERWLEHVRAYLAGLIEVKLQEAHSLRAAADAVAEFWRDTYYRLLFPVRFGLEQDVDQLFTVTHPIGAEAEVTLSDTPPLRRTFLDGSRWPPIWPDPVRGSEGWLLADRLLIEAALLNVLFVQSQLVDETTYQAARLASLTYPLYSALKQAAWMQGQVAEIGALFADGALQGQPVVERLASVANTFSRTAPIDVAGAEVGLVLVAGQRIKQYVFDTPGLNEIRGGSTLLDEAEEAVLRRVSEEIGPEAILRAGGSTVLFIAPANDALETWPGRLRRMVFAETKAAFPAAAAIRVRIEELVNHFNGVVGRVFGKMGEDRAQAQLPRFVTYPFETRCALCQMRAAHGWAQDPEGNDRPICEVCQTKRTRGRAERRDKIMDVLVDLGIADYNRSTVRLDMLGVRGARRQEWVADDLENLVYQGARRKLIGVVYGDGNNFGAVQIQMNDMALNLQWAARVENTTRAAVALALGRATQKVAQFCGWQPGEAPLLAKLPFQVLAVGGDDLMLFAWGPVAVHFAAEFTRLTDLELQVSRQDPHRPRPELNFSLGVLLTDEKTPVRKSVQFAEKELLKWAKQAVKARGLKCGTITMLYAEKADKVPADLKSYREEMYLLGLGRHFQLCTTLRPYTAAELNALLNVAGEVLEQDHLGRLQRLVSAFYGARQGAFAGMLHYAYQKGRVKDGGWIAQLEAELATVMGNQVQAVESALLIDYRTAKPNDAPTRTPFGIEPQRPTGKEVTPVVRFSPLWDLLELAKLMS